MKKFKKIVACGLALASVVGTTYAEIAPHKEVLKADTQIQQMKEVAEFQVASMPQSANVGEEVTLPEVAGATVSVTDFNGNNVAVTSSKFTVTKASDYTVTYTKGEVSKSFVIKVSGDQASLEFGKNTENFIPSEIFIGEKVNLPSPVNENVKSYKIFVNDSTTELAKQADKYVFTADKAGTYSIRYDATLQNDEVVTSTFTVKVVNTNAYSVDVGYEFSKAMPTEAEAGEVVELPSVTTNNKKNDNASLKNYTNVKVDYHKADGTVVENIPVKFVEADSSSSTKAHFEFTPEYLADGTSYYEVKYTINTVHSSFGNTVTTPIVETYRIRTVKDSKLIFETLNLKQTVKAGTVTFKPELKNEFDQNATITVTIKDRNKEEVTVTNNNDGTYSFTAAAGQRYTIVMNAQDASGNETTTDGFIVSAVATDEEAPKVENIVCNKTTASAGEQVEFILPEAEDAIATTFAYTVSVNDDNGINFTYKDSEGNAKTVDAQNPLVAGDKVYFNMPNQKAVIKVSVSDGSKTTDVTYTVKLKDSVAPTLAVSSTDAIGEVNQGETIILPNVTVTDANIFSTAVYFNLTIDGEDCSDQIYNFNNKTYTNLTTVQYKNVKFVASKAGEAKLTVTAVDADNNMLIKVYSFEITSTSNAVMSIGKMPTEVKVYEKTELPTPKFKDDADHIWHVIAVGEETPAHQIIEEGGKRYFIAQAPGTYILQYKVFNATTFDIETESVPYTITAKDSDAPVFTLDNSAPVPIQVPFEGTQTEATVYLPGFKSVADSGSSENVKQYKLTVKDTDDKEYTVTFNNVKKGEPKVSDSTILSYDKATNKFTLKVNQVGSYTFKYEVTDFNGNTTSIDTAKEVNGEMKLVVGDIYAPEMDASKLNIKTSYKENENFIANIKDLKLDDNKTDFDTNPLKEYKNKRLTVALYNGSTSVDIVVDENTGDITLKNGGALEVGDNYRLVLTLKDEAGNPTPLTYNISVKANETKSVSHEKVWGIVLICVSVAVLGAVVVYFVATRDKKAPSKLTKKEENKTEQE